jgi:hypothetical protein
MPGKAPLGATRFADLLEPGARRAALEQRLIQARDAGYWEGLPAAPSAATSREATPREGTSREGTSREGTTSATGDLREEGYARRPGVVDAPTTDAARRRVEQVMAHGWPPVFAFVYDELWAALTAPGLVAAIERAVGGSVSLWPGVWIHRVEARAGAAGWGPHADEPHARALTDDGRPARVSGWLALTPATVDNGCIHLVAADTRTDALREGRGPSWREAAVALHHARALEAAAGDLLLWRTDVLHWGGRRWSETGPARVALTFEVAPSDVRPTSGLWAAPLRPPSFDARLQRIGYALGAYGQRREREPLAHRLLPLAEELRR